MSIFKPEILAGIQYHGNLYTQPCIDAVIHIVQCAVPVDSVLLLSFQGMHCFLISVNEGEWLAIKSGFRSGYSGEGPKGLSYVLQIFEQQGIDVEEVLVDERIIRRIDGSCLTQEDLDWVLSRKPIRPVGWHEYIYQMEGASSEQFPDLRRHFPFSIPYRIIDPRIMDLAVKLAEDQDAAILAGYRRLEQIVARRCQLELSGMKLFAKAFQADDSVLTWRDLESTEAKGRASLFGSVYMGFRNRRAHKEIPSNGAASLREFLLLNELFVLESEASDRI